MGSDGLREGRRDGYEKWADWIPYWINEIVGGRGCLLDDTAGYKRARQAGRWQADAEFVSALIAVRRCRKG